MFKLFDIQPRLFVRNLEAGYLWENFFISAIAALLSLRFMLQLFDYPVVGRGNFHIAHMLWGGLLMLFSILLLIFFINKEAKQLASVVGGLGFGVFIDELGKFITSNNDYFFKPTIAMIYVIFMCLFLLIRASEKYLPLSKKDYAVNAIEILKDVFVSELDEQEKKRAMLFLRKSDPQNPLVLALKEVLKITKIQEPDTPSIISKAKSYVRDIYLKVVYHPWFTVGIITFFVTSSFISLIQSVVSFRSLDSFSDIGHVLSSTLASLLVIFGTYLFQRGHRYLAYDTYRYAVLVNIFLTQFFMFYQEELAALLELFGSITVYITLRYLLTQEEIENPDSETHVFNYLKQKLGFAKKL